MPSTATGSNNSSSVFARLTGRRHLSQAQQHSLQKANVTDLHLPLGGSPDGVDDAGPPPIVNGHYRRETNSSILSLTNSVTDLGNSVKRSVSLRSHRTTPSNSSSFGRGTRSPPGLSTVLTSFSSTASPLESPEEANAKPFYSNVSPPRSRGRPSLSVRTLTHKFKSTDALPKFTSPDSYSALERSPPSAHPLPTSNLPSMLVSTQPNNPGPTRAPPERPSLPTPSASYSHRELASSHGGVPEVPKLQRTNTASAVAANGGQNPSAVYQQIQETSAKRMATIDYLRRVHEGDIFYFSTLHYSNVSLAAMSSMQPHKLGRRATSYFILGYSLPAILDMNSGSPLEYLKALSALLQEFETYQTLSGYDSSGSSLSRGRMAGMLKSGMNLGGRSGRGRRSSTTAESIVLDSSRSAELLGIPRSAGSDASSPHDLTSPIIPTGLEFTHLMTPHLPFEPDFSTTFATLCDTLFYTYGKLTDLVAGPDACGPGVGEAFTKADKSIRKILVSNVIREFEDTARTGVKAEVAGLSKVVLGGLM